MRGLVLYCGVISLACAADDGFAGSDRAYVEALAAYDQAQNEVVLGHETLAREQLISARRWSDLALAELTVMAQTNDAPGIKERIVAIRAIGRPCCGKPTLWDRLSVDARAPQR